MSKGEAKLTGTSGGWNRAKNVGVVGVWGIIAAIVLLSFIPKIVLRSKVGKRIG